MSADFRASIGIAGHIRTNCSTPTKPAGASPSSPPTSTINPNLAYDLPLSSSTASTSAAAAPVPNTRVHSIDAPTNRPSTISDAAIATAKGTAPLLSADGITLLNEKTQILSDGLNTS
nr:unnamed protein product [Spirometra erinaceieuropaei]